jgi:hypothetical protein
MLKIIIIIIGYTLNNFTTHIIVDDGKIHNFKKNKFNHFFEKKIYSFLSMWKLTEVYGISIIKFLLCGVTHM